jgi:hypothetical protein
MITEIIQASALISFQRFMRKSNLILIRAVPFTNAENVECYRLMYVRSAN